MSLKRALLEQATLIIRRNMLCVARRVNLTRHPEKPTYPHVIPTSVHLVLYDPSCILYDEMCNLAGYNPCVLEAPSSVVGAVPSLQGYTFPTMSRFILERVAALSCCAPA